MNKIEKYWTDFLQNHNLKKDTFYAGELSFENTDNASVEELALILCGKKQARASALEAFELDNEKIPKSGSFYVLSDWNGEPKGVIQITDVTVLPFEDVTWEMAQKEGEDDSLESWRGRYTEFFDYDSSIMGYEFTPSMPVVFECFQLMN